MKLKLASSSWQRYISICLTCLSLSISGFSPALNAEDQVETDTESISLAEEATISLFEQITPLCKDNGKWKLTTVKIPDSDEEINCATLMKIEFDLMIELDGSANDEKNALRCVTQGMDAQDKLTFARSLEKLGELSLPLD